MNMLEMIRSFPQYCEQALNMGTDIELGKHYTKFMSCGMGGSGIPGDFLKSIVSDIPVFVNKKFSIPSFIDEQTLAFIVSYSGKTAETLSAYKKCKDICDIVFITSNKKFEHEKRSVIIPSGLVPRATLPYLFLPMVSILNKHNYTHINTSHIKDVLAKVSAEQARKLANICGDKTPIIYAPDHLYSAAYRWKTQVNENAKSFAFCNKFPELSHNEICAYHDKTSYQVIIFQDGKLDKRSKGAKELISKTSNVEIITAKGTHILEKILYLVHLGDHFSYYLGEKRGVDPVKTPNIKKIKESI